MNKEPIQMTPGDDLHLTLLMAPLSLNFVTGQDREHLLAFGRAAFEAGQSSKCLHQIAEPAENNLTRFCPECGHVGEVSNMHRDCCPDGSHAFMVPAKYAHELRDGFKALLHNAQRRGLATPNTLPQAFTGGSEMQRAFEIEHGQSWSDPNWRRETGIWASAWRKATNAVQAKHGSTA